MPVITGLIVISGLLNMIRHCRTMNGFYREVAVIFQNWLYASFSKESAGTSAAQFLKLGSGAKRIALQRSFIDKLSDAIEVGIGN